MVVAVLERCGGWLRFARSGARLLVRLWWYNVRHGRMMGTTLACAIPVFLFIESLWIWMGGVLRALGVTIPNVELGVGYWLHAIGISPWEALLLAIGLSAGELLVWSALYAAVLRGWPAWSQDPHNADDVANLGELAETLTWFSRKASLCDTDMQSMPRGLRWAFRHPYLFLFCTGIVPGAFLLLGLPFAFKFEYRFFWVVMALGNSVKMALSIFGWVALHWPIALALLIGVGIVSKKGSLWLRNHMRANGHL